MLDITVSVVNGLAVVSLTGALVRGQGSDHLTEVVEWLCEAGEGRIALHTAGVSAVDVDGLVALLGCHASVSSTGGDLVINMPSGPLRRALRRTGLDELLRIVDGRSPDPSHSGGREA
jgi:anti-anti-sigma factor